MRKYWKNQYGYLKSISDEDLKIQIAAFTSYKKTIKEILADNGYNLIWGTDDIDVLTYDTAQKVYTNEGDDKKTIILGGNGDDEIYFNGHRYRNDANLSQIIGGFGNDTIIAKGENVLIRGDYGKDDIGGADVIYGSNGNDIIFGEGGWDQLHGEGGMDHIYGNAHNDILYGGRGNDDLYGDAGNDTYMFYSIDNLLKLKVQKVIHIILNSL